MSFNSICLGIIGFFIALYALWRMKRHMFKKSLKDQIVLLTGGASGLGYCTAIRLAREGANVIVWDVNQEGMNKLKAEFDQNGWKLSTKKVDLCNRLAIEEEAKAILSEHGRLDILINNAGVVVGRPFLECPPELTTRTMDVNINAHFWTVRSFLPQMMERNSGHIVSIASMAGHVGCTKLADYVASKHAAVGFDESLRFEFRKYNKNIQTTCICPFYIQTPLFEGAKTSFPLMPILTPDYVASQVVSSIRLGDELVMLPFAANTLPMLRLFPVPVQDFILQTLGVLDSMDHFVVKPPAGTETKQKKVE